MSIRRLVVLAVPAVLILGGCSAQFGAPETASEQGEDVLSTWRLFVVIGLVVVALIWGLVAFAIIRYRRRSAEQIPGQRQYNAPLEIVYTIAPIILVGVLFGVAVMAEDRITANDPDPDLEIEVIGFQWQWQFNYLDEGISVTGVPEQRATLRVPVGATVRFDLIAHDVIHDFWVPEFLVKRDLIPGIDNEIDIDITRAGTWTGRCAEYCGFDHGRMIFDVEAMPPDEFEAWIADVQGGGATDDPSIRLVEATR